MLVTFDGFAASGKSTCAQLLAESLGWPILRTGTAHRMNVWLMLDRGVNLADENAVAEHLSGLDIRFEVTGHTLQPVLAGLKPDPEVLTSAAVRNILAQVTRLPLVCQAMAEQFRTAVVGRSVVAEGHGLGTGIFPNANAKFFCEAPLWVRAERRFRQEGGSDTARTLCDVERELSERDLSDAQRPVNPVRRTPEMVVLDTWRRSASECAEQARKVIAGLRQGWLRC